MALRKAGSSSNGPVVCMTKRISGMGTIVRGRVGSSDGEKELEGGTVGCALGAAVGSGEMVGQGEGASVGSRLGEGEGSCETVGDGVASLSRPA